jgi:hypothetical protein
MEQRLVDKHCGVGKKRHREECFEWSEASTVESSGAED